MIKSETSGVNNLQRGWYDKDLLAQLNLTQDGNSILDLGAKDSSFTKESIKTVPVTPKDASPMCYPYYVLPMQLSGDITKLFLSLNFIIAAHFRDSSIEWHNEIGVNDKIIMSESLDFTDNPVVMFDPWGYELIDEIPLITPSNPAGIINMMFAATFSGWLMDISKKVFEKGNCDHFYILMPNMSINGDKKIIPAIHYWIDDHNECRGFILKPFDITRRNRVTGITPVIYR